MRARSVEDAFFARDRAEADATETRGKLAEATTEARRWRARCGNAAERLALDAERRAEKDAMRAVVADARAGLLPRRRGSCSVPDTYGHSVSGDALARVGAASEKLSQGSAAPDGSRTARRRAHRRHVRRLVEMMSCIRLWWGPRGRGSAHTPGPAMRRYLSFAAFPNLETPEGASAPMGLSAKLYTLVVACNVADPRNRTRTRATTRALSRRGRRGKKLRACESALRLAETAKADAETRAAAAALLAESDRRETGTSRQPSRV